jgi:nucleoside-diphosphate-sugar epimerase
VSDIGTVAITGASGYVGGALCDAFRAIGYRVLRLQRTIPAAADPSEYVPFTLETGVKASLGPDLKAVVHCAYDLQARTRAEVERVNLDGTKRLLDAAGASPVVLISSMSAYAGTRSLYGRTKLACEQMVERSGGTSLRLGLVYGGGDGGMIGSLGRVAKLPVVPCLLPDSYQYTVHIDDMVRCVSDAVAVPPPHRAIGVANPHRLSFRSLMADLHRSATHRPLRAVPMPAGMLYVGLRAFEGVGLRLNFRADSLIGLMQPAPDVPHVRYWEQRGIELRDWTMDVVAI